MRSCALLLLWTGSLLAQPSAPAETFDSVSKLYQAERATAPAIGSPKLLARCDAIADRAKALSAAGQGTEAVALIRQARWLLPAGPAAPVPNLSRVYGSARLRHDDVIHCLAYSADGRRLITGSKDGTARIWDLDTGRERVIYRGHAGLVRSVALSNDGKIAASVSDKEVHLWNPATGVLIRKLSGASRTLNSVAISPDSTQVFAGGDDQTSRLWNAADGKVIQEFGAQSGAITSVAFSPNGKLLGTGTSTGQLQVWNPASTDPGKRMPLGVGVHPEAVQQIQFGPDGTTVATCGERRAKIINSTAPDGKPLDQNRNGTQKFQFSDQHTGTIHSLAWSRDGKWLATASSDKTVRVWEVSGANRVVRVLFGHAEQVNAVAFSPNGEQLASAGGDGQVRLWTMLASDSHRTLAGHTDYVWSAVVRPDGTQIASGGADRTVRLWDFSTGQLQHTLTGHSLPITTVEYSPDGAMLLSCGGDKLIKLWDPKAATLIRDLRGHEAAVMAAMFDAAAQRILSGAADRLVKIWDAKTGNETATLKGHRAAVSAVAWSREGDRAASASADGVIKIWDVAKKAELASFTAHSLGVASLAFSPDGKRLASCGGDGRVRLWNLVSPTPDAAIDLDGHSGPVSSVAFSPDGRFLISGGSDTTIKIWSVQTWSELRTLRGHTDWIGSVAYSRDGQAIVSTSVDRTVRVWQNKTDDAAVAPGHLRAVSALAVSPDGRWLASAGYDRSVRVWDLATGDETQYFVSRSDEVLSLAFSADGKFLVAGGVDGKLALWEVPSGKETKPIDDAMRIPAMVFQPGTSRFVAWLRKEVSNNGNRSTLSTINVYDAATSSIVDTYTDRDRFVTCLAFTADGKWAVSGDESGSVRIHDVVKRARVGGDLPTHAKRVGDVAISSDQKILITGDDDGEVKIWNVEKREPRETIQAHQGGLGGIVLSADSRRFATFDHDGQVKIWDTATGKNLRTWDLARRVAAIAYSPDGRTLITANADGTLFRLDTP